MASINVSNNPSSSNNTLIVNFTTDVTNINDIQISKDKIKYYEGFTVRNKKQIIFALNKLENIHNKLKEV